MAKKLDIVPPDLQALLPEANAQKVVIGDSCYEMLPLPEGMLESISKVVAEIAISAVQSKGGAVKAIVEAVFSKEGAPRIIATVLDIDVEAARKTTLVQMQHFTAVFYDQNFSEKGLPSESRKNFDKLLGRFGLRTPRAAQDQACMEKLAVLVQTLPGESIRKEDMMRVMAEALDSERYSTFFPPSTDGARSTSSARESGSAPSPAPSATLTSGETDTSSLPPFRPLKQREYRATPERIAEHKQQSRSGGETAGSAGKNVSSNTES